LHDQVEGAAHLQVPRQIKVLFGVSGHVKI